MRYDMEMGVLITGSNEPGLLQEHLRALLERGEFALKTKAEIRTLAGL